MQARDHNKIFGILLLVNGGLQVLGGLIAGLIYGGMGIALLGGARRSEEQTVGAVFLVIAVVAVLFVFAFAGLFLFSGWKVFKEAPSGRTLGIIASCVALLGFPLGTALGIYGLWFLLGEQGKQFYSGGNQMNYQPPPPPHNWQ